MSLLTPLLWSFLPSQLTHILLPYLSGTLPTLFPPAQRGTPTYARNYRVAFTGVITLYLAYTFVRDTSSSSDPGEADWYTLLGVGRGVDDQGLKRAFRSLSRLHHPDRAGSGNSNASDETFILVRRAYETLTDPVKRYAYDRFGPSILSWKAASVREYTLTGLSNSVGFYLVSGGLMILLSLLGRAREGAFWRQTLFVILLLAELNLILSPSPRFPIIPIISHLSPGLPLLSILYAPQFVQIQFLHKLFTTLSIAITQLAGVWTPQAPSVEEEWERVVRGLRGLEMEAITSFQNEVVPLMSAGDPRKVESLIQRRMEDVLVERSISSHPQIRERWQAAQLSRAMRHAPARFGHAHPHPHPFGRVSVSGMDQLELARRIALPPSPPPSPVPKRRVL